MDELKGVVAERREAAVISGPTTIRAGKRMCRENTRPYRSVDTAYAF